VVCVFNFALFPLVVADKVLSEAFAAVIAFCSIALIYGLNEVARELEDPFTTELGLCAAATFHFPLSTFHFPRSAYEPFGDGLT
jgi:ABC-type Co2+ transport system permease subunit